MTASESMVLFDVYLKKYWAPTTRKKYMNLVSQFVRKCGNKDVQAYSADELSMFVNAPDSAKYNTRIMRLAVVRVWLQFCRSNGWIGKYFAENLVKVNYRALPPHLIERTKRIPFTEEELQLLIAGAKGRYEWLKYAIIIAKETGLRNGDIAMLKWSQVGPETLIVFTQKRRHRIPIAMSPELKEMFANFPDRPPVSEVVDALRDHIEIPVFGDDIVAAMKKKPCWMSTQFGYLCRRVQIYGKTFYCIRHYFADKCRRLGVKPKHLASMMAHSHESTTAAYGTSFIIEAGHPLNLISGARVLPSRNVNRRGARA